MKTLRRRIVLGTLLLLFVCIQVLYWFYYLNSGDIISLKHYFLSATKSYPIVSGITYIVIYVFSIIFGIPISATMIGGYIFSIMLAILYTCIAIFIGTLLLSTLVRFFIKDFVEKRYKNKLKFFDDKIKKYGVLYIVLIHMIPFMPSFLPNVAMSLSSIPLYKIVVTNFLGALPLTVLYVFAGHYLHEVTTMQSLVWYISIFGGIIAFLFILGRTLIVYFKIDS